MKPIKLLFAILSIIALLMATPVAASELPKAHENVGKLVLGDFENPISIDQIEGARAEVNREAESLLAKANPAKPKLVPTLPEGHEGAIVAYAYLINQEGTPIQFVGTAGNKEAVSGVTNKANTWFETALDSTNTDEYNARGADWGSPIGQGTDYYDNPPYGVVLNSYQLYYLNDDNNSTYDWFAVHQFHDIEPGCHAYGSSWENEESKPSHDWSWGDVEYSLFSYSPTGTLNGSQTVGVSITGGTGGASASLGWSYTQPDITTYDDTSIPSKTAAWRSSFSGSAREYACGMEPGSVCQTYQQSSGTYDLVKVQSLGKFEYYFVQTHEFGFYWPLQISY